MENGEVKIPTEFTLLGNKISVGFNEQLCDKHNALGLTKFSENVIVLTSCLNGQDLPEDTIMHTYWHETVHQILDKMGESELRDNEKFVDLLGGMIYQVLKTSIYDNSRKNKTSIGVNKRSRKRA